MVVRKTFFVPFPEIWAKKVVFSHFDQVRIGRIETSIKMLPFFAAMCVEKKGERE